MLLHVLLEEFRLALLFLVYRFNCYGSFQDNSFLKPILDYHFIYKSGKIIYTINLLEVTIIENNNKSDWALAIEKEVKEQEEFIACNIVDTARYNQLVKDNVQDFGGIVEAWKHGSYESEEELIEDITSFLREYTAFLLELTNNSKIKNK
jgi:hypothetical protein